MRDRRITDVERRDQAPPYRRDYSDGPGAWSGDDHGLSLWCSPPARVVLGVGAVRPCARDSGWPTADARA